MRGRKGGCMNVWRYVLTRFKCPHSRMRQPASGSVRLRGGGGWRDGYAQVPQIHHRSRLDHRLRLLRQPRAVWVAHQVLKTTRTRAKHACWWEVVVRVILTSLLPPSFRYSPLHNLPLPPYSGPAYPAVLLLTADHDDRVVPLHTLKYCAALQHGVGSSPVQRQPLMVRVDTCSGHGAGKPTYKVILEDTDIFSFIAETLGLSWRDWEFLAGMSVHSNWGQRESK